MHCRVYVHDSGLSVNHDALSVYAAWNPPSKSNGEIRHYEITMTNLLSLQTITHFVDGQTLRATISHLQPNQTYNNCYCNMHITPAYFVAILFWANILY